MTCNKSTYQSGDGKNHDRVCIQEGRESHFILHFCSTSKRFNETAFKFFVERFFRFNSSETIFQHLRGEQIEQSVSVRNDQ